MWRCRGKGMRQLRSVRLIEQRKQMEDRMAEMQKSLDRLNAKIDGYEQGLMKRERILRDGMEE